MPYPVLQMKDILDKKYLPATVKLLYGRKPSMTCEFTDILRLEYSHFERSVRCAFSLHAANARLYNVDDTISSFISNILNFKGHVRGNSMKLFLSRVVHPMTDRSK
jgi:hypothetical protein